MIMMTNGKSVRRGLALAGATVLLAGCVASAPAPYQPAPPQVSGQYAPYQPAYQPTPPPVGYYRSPPVGASVRYSRGGSYIGYSTPGSYRYRPTLADTIMDSMIHPGL